MLRIFLRSVAAAAALAMAGSAPAAIIIYNFSGPGWANYDYNQTLPLTATFTLDTSKLGPVNNFGFFNAASSDPGAVTVATTGFSTPGFTPNGSNDQISWDGIGFHSIMEVEYTSGAYTAVAGGFEQVSEGVSRQLAFLNVTSTMMIDGYVLPTVGSVAYLSYYYNKGVTRYDANNNYLGYEDVETRLLSSSLQPTSSGASAVPEPGALGLLGLGVLGVALRRRRDPASRLPLPAQG